MYKLKPRRAISSLARTNFLFSRAFPFMGAAFVSFFVHRLSAAGDEVERLDNDLMLLNAALHEMDGDQVAECREEIHLKRQIKELLYDAQDIRESWLIHLAANDTTYGGLRLGTELVEEINSIRQHRLRPMRRMIGVYRDLQLQPKQPTKANRVPSVQLNNEVLPIRQTKIDCFAKEEEALRKNLMKKTEEVDVISITGMPGIGKTTLAWKIYQNEEIKGEFPTRIWVDIPIHFSRRDLYLNIIKEYIKQGVAGYEDVRTQLSMPSVTCSVESYLHFLDAFAESGKISDDQLIDGVRACLKMSKFLLVLDDVWTDVSLSNIMLLLPKCGKVLITTCNAYVMREPHVMRLRFRNDEESWELLQREVFGRLGVCPETLRSAGRAIAQNCGGLPLAIAAVGARLGVASSAAAAAAEYLNEQWWKKVSENVMVHVTDHDQRRIFTSTELKYTALTQQLQDCFLYLGVFPQDYEIPASTVTRLWIAERLIQDNRSATPEEAAEQTLSDLVNRNLVIAGKIYPNGEIKTCRLHKFMYAFCKYKAAELEFYHEIKSSGGGAIDGLISLAPYHRRLCINSHLPEFLSTARKERHVRSLLCLNEEDKAVLHPKHISTIHKSFKWLKIFECKVAKFTKFPTMLYNLMNLRYISLSCDNLDVIPETISSLCYLETLVVHTESASVKVKANIWRMSKLRHLVTKAAIFLAMKGEGEAGKDLHTLTRFAPVSCTKDVFTRAPNLKRLGIRGNLADLSDADSLKKLERLENLKMVNEPAREIQLDPYRFPPTIKWLTLSGTYLKWASMSTLGKIESLEILKLKNNAFLGESWSSRAEDGFGRLRFLLIRTTDLVSWEASDDCFPSLEHLVLNDCENLQQIPSTPPRNLYKLDVDETVSEAVAEFAGKINQARAESNE
ncbi:putative late blight resistance protein homolog R1A-10 [Salvia miltiorrhiza]|uniref:putative late blight resistance protein homolog R1A-10 n=1 Tax=Salvia miltiorrhiza TaxID=226208 RepID=UPI0025AD4F0D|nr:putative late blight resistance protein homolog R1A-10 [Salvia miltiorrhiza]